MSLKELERKGGLPAGDGFYRWVMETGNQGVWYIDDKGLTKFANARMAAMLRTTPEEMLGKSVLDFIPPEDHDRLRHAFTEFVERRRSLVREHRYRRADGTHFAAVLESTPCFDEQGKFVGGLAMVMDISAWKAAEEGKRTSDARVEAVEAQLRQSQKMEAVGRLAGGIAHDFNNMLSVILGYGDSLLERVKDDPSAYEDVEEIMAAGRRAAELTRQLLLFSRRHLAQLTVVDLVELLDGMQKMLERIVGEDVETVFVPYRGMSLARVLIDRSGIEMVLLNLVVNARDAMPNGGTLTIALEERGPNVVLRVEDSGHGMDEATKARAFDPFFTTKEAGKGTGLGLSTAYGIVEQAGGTIHIESAPGRGTTFEIAIPRATESFTTSPPPPSAGPRSSPATILLVEDDDQVRAVARRALERQGHTVLEARSAMEALEVHGDYELLITDVIMPHLSGSELARRLVDRRPELKVVFMSGYTDAQLSPLGVSSASVAYVQKPFTPADLAKKVREVIGSS